MYFGQFQMKIWKSSTDNQVEWLLDKEIHRQVDKQAYRQVDRQAYRQAVVYLPLGQIGHGPFGKNFVFHHRKK